MRVARNFTLNALSRRIGFSTTQISDVERGASSASQAFVAACDQALDAGGRLLALLPAMRIEQQVEREKRETSRRGALRSCQESMT